jgi:hypothetical protein
VEVALGGMLVEVADGIAVFVCVGADVSVGSVLGVTDGLDVGAVLGVGLGKGVCNLTEGVMGVAKTCALAVGSATDVYCPQEAMVMARIMKDVFNFIWVLLFEDILVSILHPI